MTVKPKDLSLSLSMKQFFFDRPKVIAAIGKANAKALSKIGAFIRQRARTQYLRRRKRVSVPGEGPSVHSQNPDASLRKILFAVSPALFPSLLVGPAKLNQVDEVGAVTTQRTTVPGLLEFGGTASILEWRFMALDNRDGWWDRFTSSKKFANEWRRADRRWQLNSAKRKGRSLKRLGVEYRRRPAVYAPRPFMAPALKDEAKNMPAAFAGLLRSA